MGWERYLCHTCGHNLKVDESGKRAECPACKNEYFYKTDKEEALVLLLNTAWEHLYNHDFDQAIIEYTAAWNRYPNDSEAAWGVTLSTYGIVYAKDYDGNMVPTCSRIMPNSILQFPAYISAIENCADEQRPIYERKAKEIDHLQNRIKQAMDKEEDYDVFISFKAVDDDGNPTEDSVIARRIYDETEKRGIKTFFSAVTLRDRIGDEYEPIIYRALHSCKVFILVATDIEYVNAPWVKNEWTRFRDRAKEENLSGKSFAVFKNVQPYELPSIFHSQGINLSKYPMGGYEIDIADNLCRKLGIKKKQDDQRNEELNKRLKEQEVLFQTQQKQFEETQRQMDERLKMMKNITTGGENGSKTAPLLIRASQEMDNRKFAEATKYYDRVLDMDPTSSEAWLGKFWSTQKILEEKDFCILSAGKTREECQENYYANQRCLKPFDEQYFRNACKYAETDKKTEILAIKTRISNRCDSENKKIFAKIFSLGTSALKKQDFDEGKKCFEFLVENDPTEARSHWNLFLSEQHVKSNDDFLATVKKDNITALQKNHVKNALKFADDDFKAELNNVFSRMEQCAAENHWKAYLNSCNKSQSGNDVVTMVKTQNVPRISYDLSDVKLAYSMADENLKEEMDHFFSDINREAKSRENEIQKSIVKLENQIKADTAAKQEMEKNASDIQSHIKRNIFSDLDYGLMVTDHIGWNFLAVIALTVFFMIIRFPNIIIFTEESWSLLSYPLNWIVRLVLDLIISVAIVLLVLGIIYFIFNHIGKARKLNNGKVRQLQLNLEDTINDYNKKITETKKKIVELKEVQKIFKKLSVININSLIKEKSSIVLSADAELFNISEKKPTTGKTKTELQNEKALTKVMNAAFETGKISNSMVQRLTGFGSTRAANILNIMEEKGFITGPNGSAPRRLLVTREEFEKIWSEEE